MTRGIPKLRLHVPNHPAMNLEQGRRWIPGLLWRDERVLQGTPRGTLREAPAAPGGGGRPGRAAFSTEAPGWRLTLAGPDLSSQAVHALEVGTQDQLTALREPDIRVQISSYHVRLSLAWARVICGVSACKAEQGGSSPWLGSIYHRRPCTPGRCEPQCHITVPRGPGIRVQITSDDCELRLALQAEQCEAYPGWALPVITGCAHLECVPPWP